MLWGAKPSVEQAVAQIAELNGPERCAVALSTALQLLSNAIDDPARFGSIKQASKTLRSRILDQSGGAVFFESLGFCASGEAYVIDSTLDEAELRRRQSVLRDCAARAEGVLAAVIAVGDGNAPAVAVGAVKLARTYIANVLAHESDESKRRITSSNKALGTRLLSAAGGPELMRSVGFVPEPAENPESYLCTAPASELRVALATLDQAEGVWASIAAAAGVTVPSASAASSDESKVADAIQVSEITILKLPPASSLQTRLGTADLEPALARDEEGAVVLLCWMSASKRWRPFGRMLTPSTTFEWVRPSITIPATGEQQRFELIVEVDLGDGKPRELGYLVVEGQPENEYVAADRFIGQHFELLNNGSHLEEIARNLRTRVGPVVQTLKNLVVAMEAQN